jgi:hypothetical protein
MQINEQYKNWTIKEYVEELIFLEEMAEVVPHGAELKEECKREIMSRFTKEEREKEGLVF